MGTAIAGEPATGAGQLLDVRGLTKIFGALTACDHVDLIVGKGEIHALLGENGAG
ncbi:MAG: ABC transporter ATP-binding protein, partial [Mesorhizobium sp.]|nr:ABC transporter ATP-binding protein [Mesorhizobium sp.]